jgi:hypothetical protein
MKPTNRFCIGTLAAVLLTAEVPQASSQTKFFEAPQAPSQSKFFWGEGYAPCSEWTKQRGAKTVVGTQLAAWVRGYISGVNVQQNLKDNIIGTATAEMDSAEKWIGDYCLAHPSDRLVIAADLLVKTLYEQAR